jgi:prevent-host-death family protein
MIMKSVSANEAKQSLGRVLDAAQREPIVIRKHNRDAAIVISPAEYDRLRGINAAEFSAFCDRVGQAAGRKGLTESKLNALLGDE